MGLAAWGLKYVAQAEATTLVLACSTMLIRVEVHPLSKPESSNNKASLKRYRYKQNISIACRALLLQQQKGLRITTLT
jgi:hypothetical protein